MFSFLFVFLILRKFLACWMIWIYQRIKLSTMSDICTFSDFIRDVTKYLRWKLKTYLVTNFYSVFIIILRDSIALGTKPWILSNERITKGQRIQDTSMLKRHWLLAASFGKSVIVSFIIEFLQLVLMTFFYGGRIFLYKENIKHLNVRLDFEGVSRAFFRSKMTRRKAWWSIRTGQKRQRVEQSPTSLRSSMYVYVDCKYI